MKRLGRLSWLVLALSLLLSSLPALALMPGSDYLDIPPQPVNTKGRVEVIEFFWYGCPHCFHLEDELNAWAGKLPKDVVLKRQPAVLNDGWMPLARAYYALASVGAVGRLHDAVFNAIHEQHVDLSQPATFFDWAARHGVDRRKLASAYDSFYVNTMVARARQMTQRYKITGVPSFVVDGKYQTSAYLTGGHEQLFETLDALIDQERRHKRR
jgi:protein dithiol oxidoreductase (disulfide-forming)